MRLTTKLSDRLEATVERTEIYETIQNSKRKAGWPFAPALC